jgi:hypothetical protein
VILGTRPKFVLGTPTKTGTMSTMAFVASSPDLKLIERPHSPYVPNKYRSYPRIMLVRDPIERFISLYRYTQNVNAWQYNNVHGMSIREFARWFADMRMRFVHDMPKHRQAGDRAPWMWLWSLSEFREVFEPDKELFIEEVYDHLVTMGVRTYRDKMNEANISDNREDGVRVAKRQLSGSALRIVEEEWM